MPERIANGKEKWVDLMHMNIRRTFFVSFGTMRGAFLCAAQPSQPTLKHQTIHHTANQTANRHTHYYAIVLCRGPLKGQTVFLASTNAAITYDADPNSSEAISIFLVRMS